MCVHLAYVLGPWNQRRNILPYTSSINGCTALYLKSGCRAVSLGATMIHKPAVASVHFEVKWHNLLSWHRPRLPFLRRTALCYRTTLAGVTAHRSMQSTLNSTELFTFNDVIPVDCHIIIPVCPGYLMVEPKGVKDFVLYCSNIAHTSSFQTNQLPATLSPHIWRTPVIIGYVLVCNPETRPDMWSTL